MPQYNPQFSLFKSVLTLPTATTAGTAVTFSSAIFKMTQNAGYAPVNSANTIYVPGAAYKTEVLIRVADKTKITNNATGSCIALNLMGSWDGNNYFAVASYTDIANGSGAISVKNELVPAHANYFRIDLVADTNGAIATGHGVDVDFIVMASPNQSSRACFYGSAVHNAATSTFNGACATTTGETWSTQSFSGPSTFLMGTNTQQAVAAVAISYGTITNVIGTVTVIQAGSASQYPSQVITWSGIAGGTNGNITVDGKTTAITVGDTPAAIAYKIAQTVYTTTTSTENWTATGGGVVVFTGVNTMQSVAALTASMGSVGNVTSVVTRTVVGSGALYPQQAVVFVGGTAGLQSTSTTNPITIDGIPIIIPASTTSQSISTTVAGYSFLTASGTLAIPGNTLTLPGNRTQAAITSGSITTPISMNDIAQKLYITSILYGTPLSGSNCTLTLQGSIDGANWYSVGTLINNALAATAGTIVLNEVISNENVKVATGMNYTYGYIGSFFRILINDGATTAWTNSSTAYLYIAVTALY